jgi:K+-transporting ATPase ATPase C chain
MKKHLITAFLMTIATTILLGVLYPLLITALAQVLFKDKANGQLRYRNGEAIGSRIIGQPFSSARYFHSRPSAAGNGYDAGNSGGTNYAPTNQKLIDRVRSDASSLQQENPSQLIPVDLITTSASGLDPDISPAAAEFQIPRIARERTLPESAIRDLIQKHTYQRDFGLLGEPRVNVLELNLALDDPTGNSANPKTRSLPDQPAADRTKQ